MFRPTDIEPSPVVKIVPGNIYQPSGSQRWETVEAVTVVTDQVIHACQDVACVDPDHRRVICSDPIAPFTPAVKITSTDADGQTHVRYFGPTGKAKVLP